ncbi:hypothetical protein BE20_43235, partial [Sorangium cellulosum]
MRSTRELRRRNSDPVRTWRSYGVGEWVLVMRPPTSGVGAEVYELDLDDAGLLFTRTAATRASQQAPAVLVRHQTPDVREIAQRAEHRRRLRVGDLKVGAVALGSVSCHSATTRRSASTSNPASTSSPANLPPTPKVIDAVWRIDPAPAVRTA